MNPRLDTIDRRILFELDQNCRIPETRLAKIVGKSKEAVRYRIKNLRETGIIKGYSMYFDVSRLGFEGYKVYLKIREKPALKRQFLEDLQKRPDIFWTSTGDGAWNIAITFLARNGDEFYQKKNELYAQHRDIVLSEVNAAMVEGMAFPKKFLLGDEGRAVEPAYLLSKSHEVEVDAVSRKILGALMHNSRIKLVELAGECGTSIEVVRNRMKRLEEQGVIQSYSVEMDYAKMGMEFYKAFLYLEGLSPAMEKRIYEMARRHPNVLTLIKTIAPWAVELEIMVEDYAKYNEVIGQIRREFADVLINVESANMASWIEFPARKAIFE
ncbi:putative HTH-type transcriptional regulator [uncultured archaeon]|nr:putative HTH-type transcriptional regulator [uncultured archaeon]